MLNKKVPGLLIFEGQYKFKAIGKVHTVAFLIAAESLADAEHLSRTRYPKEKIKCVRIGMLGRSQEPGIFFTQTQ